MAKYFTDDEVKGLDPGHVKMLDAMREAAGIPIILTCTVRTPAENALLPDADPNSAHLRGLASDIRCHDSSPRYKLLKGAIAAGFRRIEIGTAHIHVDNDLLKPQEVCWLGKSN